jgi:hypothetical protein
MAEIDASIPLQVQTPKPIDPMETAAKAYQLKDMVLKDQLQQQEMQKQSALKDIYSNADFSTDEGRKDAIAKITKVDPSQGIQLQKDYLDQDLAKANITKTLQQTNNEKLDGIKKSTDAQTAAFGVIDTAMQTTKDPVALQRLYTQQVQGLIQSGAITPEQAKAIPQKFDPNFVHTMSLQNKDHADLVNQELTRRQDQQRIGIEAENAATNRSRLGEDERHNRAVESSQGQQVVSDKDSFGNVNYGIIDKKTGAFRQVTDPQGNAVQVGGGKAGAGAQGGGGREGAQNQRMVNAATEAGQAIENLSKLPATTDAGYFAGYEPGHGLTGITKSIMGRKLTPQDSQSYNAIFTGVAQNLGMLETSGLAAPGSLTKGIDDRLRSNEGDTVQTKLLKQAEMGQIVHKNIEAQLSNPRISDTQKDQLKRVDKQITDAIPFSVQDVIAKTQDNKSDKRPSLDSFGAGGSTTGGAGQRPSLESFGG